MSKAKSLQQIAEVVRQGRHIVLPAEPKPLSARDASTLLARLADQEEATIAIAADFAVPPYAGALALNAVLHRLFGFALRPNGSRMINVAVPVGPDEHKSACWGAFEVPGTTIKLGCDTTRMGNNFTAFRLYGQCEAQHQPIAEQLFAEIRKEIRESSIYRGKAIQIAQQGGNLDLTRPDSIRFMAVDPMLRDRLILNSETREAVETELFAPIEHYEFAKEVWGVKMNRVVLLSGTYGTGKSLTGAALAAVAVECGATFVLLKNVAALPGALELARVMELPRVVVFAEDVDRVMSGDRDADKDTLLNLLSGVESATTEVQVVLTTNNIESIHPAMIRRFQAVVEYQLPDAAATARLIELYGNGRVGKLGTVPEVLAGNLPALIEATVETAKLSAIRHGREMITGDDLLYAARQLDLIARLATREVEPEPLSTALEQVGKGMLNGQTERLAQIERKVAQIWDQIC